MKKLNSHILFSALLAVVFLLGSCQKEEIKDPVTNSTPVFTADITLDGANYLIEGGVNNAYMSTYTVIDNNVNRYSGKLGTADTYVELGLYHGNINLTVPPDIKDLQGLLNFAELPTQPLAVLSKSDFPNAINIDYIEWSVDGQFAGTNDLEIIEPGDYTICAEVHFYDGTVSTLCNQILLGYNLNATCSLNHILGNEGNLHVWINEPSSAILYVNWFVDGVSSGTSNELFRTIDDTSHTVLAEIHFENGAVRRKAILVDGSLSGKLIHDFSVVETNPQNQIRWDFAIVLNLKKDGKIYSSLGADNSASEVQFVSIEYFGENAQGKGVYKCHVTIDAVVKEQSSGQIYPVAINSSFGFEVGM